MSARVFLDTNVLVYSYSNDDLAKKALAEYALQTPDAWLSTQVLTEFANVYNRKLKVGWPQVEAALKQLAHNFSIHINSVITIAHATRLAERYGFSWFDSLIVAAALECGCDTLYSEDLQHRQLLGNTLRVVNPFLP